MPISFKAKPKEESLWVKEDPSKPFERCQDIAKLPQEVLDQLEKEGYDEDDTSKVYKFTVGDYTYRISCFRDEWQCSRWAVSKKSGGWSGGGKSAGPKEWSYMKMIDFEIGNLNDLREIVHNQEINEDESWELVPYFNTNDKGEPVGAIRLLKRITMIGSETKEDTTKE